MEELEAMGSDRTMAEDIFVVGSHGKHNSLSCSKTMCNMASFHTNPMSKITPSPRTKPMLLEQIRKRIRFPN